MPPVTTRRLSAIMFTDLVGYTAMMQADENRAIRIRNLHREILERCVSTHNGEILQYYGDGTLIVFSSAVEAVSCAIAVQQALRSDKTVDLRIGIHSGDIVLGEDGIYGDAVNIASRIEGLAVSGSILVSARVSEELANHPDLQTVILGEYELKNVKHPVSIMAVRADNVVIPAPDGLRNLPKNARKSIAVLPFVNMSSDPENEYFSDGITEEILNVLARMDIFSCHFPHFLLRFQRKKCGCSGKSGSNSG